MKLAEAIGRRLPADRPSVLALTSPGDGDGKTRVLTVLAPELARRTPGGVLAVDADFRKADLTGAADACREQNARRLTSDLPDRSGRD